LTEQILKIIFFINILEESLIEEENGYLEIKA
jgi:hypothetical protein